MDSRLPPVSFFVMTLPEFIGRLHPLILHFPIAMIIVAAGVEAARLRWDHPKFAHLVTFLLGIGAAGAVLASASGWLFAFEAYPRPSLRWMLEWHRWLGIGTTALTACAAWLSWRFGMTTANRHRWLRRVIVWTAAASVSLTGHFGALMVWGEDYFGAGD